MSKIFVVTCGDVQAKTADPEMTKEEREKIKSMRRCVPENPTKVVCGLGTRYLQILDLLRIRVTPEHLEINPIAGWPVIFYEAKPGIKSSRMCLLTNGRSLPKKCFKDDFRSSSNALRFIQQEMPHNSLVCTDAYFLKLIGVGEPREKSLYEVIVENREYQYSRIIM